MTEDLSQYISNLQNKRKELLENCVAVSRSILQEKRKILELKETISAIQGTINDLEIAKDRADYLLKINQIEIKQATDEFWSRKNG